MAAQKPLVAIVMGSDSDFPTMKEAVKILEAYDIPHAVRILSAHRAPDDTAAFAKSARRSGIRVIIAAAGGAAHLAGVIASHTTLPVIGVPMETKELKGIDSLLSTVQMPSGIPVATVALGSAGAKNAALLAAEILGTHNAAIEKKLGMHKKDLVATVRKKDAEIQL